MINYSKYKNRLIEYLRLKGLVEYSVPHLLLIEGLTDKKEKYLFLKKFLMEENNA
jgi:hypothetical protein